MNRNDFVPCMLFLGLLTVVSMKYADYVNLKQFYLSDNLRTLKADNTVRRENETIISLSTILSSLRGITLDGKEQYNKSSTTSSSIIPMNASKYKRSNVIYGHIHMAKRGGTSLNGLLANKFERVCGHKGYSYDAYQANERFKELERTMLQPDNKRDRVPGNIINEIGFEDCDFISNEVGYTFWFRFDNFHGIPMELHLPCREPIDHLMSQCNHRHQKIQCDGTDQELIRSVKACTLFLNRFHMTLQNRTRTNNNTLKCYDFYQQFTTYLDYISEKLEPRRLVSEYKQRETNRPRNKSIECIWERMDLMDRVRSYLVDNYGYYKFCNECLGSENDITRTEAAASQYAS